MSFTVVGTSYKYSPIEIREKLSFHGNKTFHALLLLKERLISEAGIILSTCNRIEIYLDGNNIKSSEMIDFISQYHKIDAEKISPYIYTYEGEQALKHLLTVACGLDSLVIGETQILGQIKQALLQSEQVGFLNNLMRNIFQYSIQFAKNIHQKTKISEGKISVGSLAVDFIKEHFECLLSKNILIMGVGKVTNLVLSYLKESNPKTIFIANRNFEKAKVLSDKIGARAILFEELLTVLGTIDIIITATASPSFILMKDDLAKFVRHNFFIIDLGVPRNVDPKVKEIKNVKLFTLDELETVIKRNLEIKRQKAENVKELIDIEVGKIWPTKLEQEQVLLL